MTLTRYPSYNFCALPCVRIRENNIHPGEKHPCFFCSFPIPVDTLQDCPVCGLKKCPQCNRCLCETTDQERETLIAIHTNYCRSWNGLLRFHRIEIPGDPTIIQNAQRALEYCARWFQAGNVYPFLEGLSRPKDPHFSYDISAWMRYAIFGVTHIPANAQRILDIGPGYPDGPSIYHGAFPASEISVLDIYPERLWNTPYLRVVEGDIRQMPFSSSWFDFVSIFETIEHVNRLEALGVLDSLGRILRTGGILVLSTPNRSGWHDKPCQGIHQYEWGYEEMLRELMQRFLVLKTYGNRVDLARQQILTVEEREVFHHWQPILPEGLLSNLFSILHPAESLISVYVSQKQ